MKKILGYIIAFIGLIVVIVSTLAPIRAMISFIPAQITDIYLMIGGLVFIAIGTVLSFSQSNNKKTKEVPIYQNNQIVGYRRI